MLLQLNSRLGGWFRRFRLPDQLLAFHRVLLIPHVLAAIIATTDESTMNEEAPEALLFEEFSEVRVVASRNSLYQILAINVALGAGQRAKSCSPRPIGTGVWNKAGEIATVNFREFLFHDVGE